MDGSGLITALVAYSPIGVCENKWVFDIWRGWGANLRVLGVWPAPTWGSHNAITTALLVRIAATGCMVYEHMVHGVWWMVYECMSVWCMVYERMVYSV
jgi:hypothetical protein